MKAHKNQFDQLIQEARERMKKARIPKKKKTSEPHNKPSTSTAVHIDADDDNSRDSVTITDIKTDTDAKVDKTDTVAKVDKSDTVAKVDKTDTVAKVDKSDSIGDKTDINSENLSSTSDAGHDNDLATVDTKETADDNPPVIEDNIQDNKLLNKDESISKSNARVSLSFASTKDRAQSGEDKINQELETNFNLASRSKGTNSMSDETDQLPEKMEQESSSTESIGNEK